MARFKWKTYEELLTQLALDAIGEVIDDHPDENFYAAAFHGFYAEEEGQIGVPLLGVNSDEAIDEGYSKWGAPDWYWDDVPFEDDTFDDLQAAMQEEACRADVDHWYKTHSRFIDAIVKVAKALTSKLKNRKQTSKDFVVIVSDEESDDAESILRRCMSKAKYKKLFLEDDSEDDLLVTKVGSADPDWEPYLADLHEHENEILKMGESALPMLLHAMNLPSQRSDAAELLGLLRLADPAVIEVLRKGAATGKTSLHECAVSLAILGDFEFLFELSRDSKTRKMASLGISGLYECGVNSCVPHLPLDYQPLERYFDNKCKPAIKDLWAGSRSLAPKDIKEAFRGLESRHAEIRIHAASSLSKGKAIRRYAKKILPALVSQLLDPNAEVRRRTVNAISDWGKLAKPHASKVRKLLKDPDEMVRHVVPFCVEDIT